MRNQIIQKNLWNQTDEGEVSLSWNSSHFSNVSVITWRGMVIKINVTVRISDKSRIKCACYLIQCPSLERIFQLPYEGGKEEEFDICNGDQYLTFLAGPKSMVIRENLMASSSIEDDLLDPSIEIIYCANKETPLKWPSRDDEEKCATTLLREQVNGADQHTFTYFMEGMLIFCLSDVRIPEENEDAGRKEESLHHLILQKNSLELLYDKLCVTKGERQLLMRTLSTMFAGCLDCFFKIRNYLDENNIDYWLEYHIFDDD